MAGLLESGRRATSRTSSSAWALAGGLVSTPLLAFADHELQDKTEG